MYHLATMHSVTDRHTTVSCQQPWLKTEKQVALKHTETMLSNSNKKA